MNGLTLIDVKIDIKKEIMDLIYRRFNERNVPLIEMLTSSMLMFRHKYEDKPLYVELADKWIFDAFITSDPMEAVIVQVIAHDNEAYKLVDSVSKKYTQIDKYRGIWSDLLFPHTFNNTVSFKDKKYETVTLNMQLFIERLLESIETTFSYIVRENNIVIDELFLVTVDPYTEPEQDDTLSMECEELVNDLPIFTSDVDDIEDPHIKSIFRSFEVKEFFKSVNEEGTVNPPKYISIHKLLRSINLKLCRSLLKHLPLEDTNTLIDYIHVKVMEKLNHVMNKYSSDSTCVKEIVMAYVKSAVGINNGDIFENILYEMMGGTTDECIALYNRQSHLYKEIQNDVHNAIKEASPDLLSPITDFFLAVDIDSDEKLLTVRKIFNELVDELYKTKCCISKILNSNILLRRIYEPSVDEDDIEKFEDILESKRFKTMLISELYETLDRLDPDDLERYYRTKVKYRRAVLDTYNMKHGGNE